MARRARIITAVGVAVVASLASAAAGQAAVSSTTGAAQLLATSPASLAAGASTSDTTIAVVNEQSVVISATLSMIAMSTTGWNGVKTMTAGTCLQSFMVHMNRASATSGLLSGSVTFSTDVVGAVTDVSGVLTGVLSLTDPIFGNPGTTYATGTSGRGLELVPTLDRVTLTGTRTVNLSLTAGPDMDEMRIITLCDTPNPILPEVPIAAILPLTAILSLGAVIFFRRRRLAL
jgi:hypothetical protein